VFWGQAYVRNVILIAQDVQGRLQNVQHAKSIVELLHSFWTQTIINVKHPALMVISLIKIILHIFVYNVILIYVKPA
jgi:hypothetical protein